MNNSLHTESRRHAILRVIASVALGVVFAAAAWWVPEIGIAAAGVIAAFTTNLLLEPY